MKISKSKQELARIISENGGWRDGEFAAQDGDGGVGGYGSKPEWNSRSKYWWRAACGEWFMANKIKNHHQTALSRTEYFHLYPVPDAKPRLCESVMRSIPESESKPTIEQLAADYRNAKDYAERKQREADDAKADAEVRLKALEIAGEGIELIVSPITAKQEPELVIAVQVGDEVECIKSNINPGKYMGRIGTVSSVDVDDTSTPYLVDFGGEAEIWCHEVKFIRRP